MSAYRFGSRPVAPEELAWWHRVDPDTGCRWQRWPPCFGTIFTVLIASWALACIWILIALPGHTAQVSLSIAWPTAAIFLSLCHVRINTATLVLSLCGALFFLLNTASASDRDPLDTACAVFTLGYVLLPVAGRHHATSMRAEKHLSKATREDRVFGRAGTILSSSAQMNRASLDSGLAGEIRTANLLREYVTRIPSARIFHSLHWPGTDRADIDHAVLCGTRVVLIDSKHWKPGHYTYEDHRLLRNGHEFFGSRIRLPEAVAAVQRRLPHCTVDGIVLIHPNKGGADLRVDAPRELGLNIVTAEVFLHATCNFLAEEPGFIDSRAFAVLHGLTRRT